MNDIKIKKWIRPNWKKIDQYSNMKDVSIYRWYWEFLRRREDYQCDFLKYSLITYTNDLKRALQNGAPQEDVLSPDKYGFKALIPGSFSKYFTSTCFNPCEDNPPLSFMYRHRMAMSIYSGEYAENKGEIKTTLDDGEILLKFDLDRPINNQIDDAKSVLQERQLSRKGKLIQRRVHSDKWLNYIRALDVKTNNETFKEIGLYLGVDDLSDSALWDNQSDKDDDSLKSEGVKIVKAAEEVQFNFPF